MTQKLVDEFICHYGAPESIHTDQGWNFESSLFHEVSYTWNTENTDFGVSSQKGWND